MTSYLQLIREMDKRATDKTAKTPHEDSFVSSGSSSQGVFSNSELDPFLNRIYQSARPVDPMPNPNIHPREYGEWAAKQLMAQKTYPVGAELHRAWDVMRDGKHFCCMVTDYCMQSEAIKSARFHWPDAEVIPLCGK